MNNTYICDECKKECEYDWSEEEALQESIDNGFGDIPMQDMVIVCDSCYKEIMGIE